jgi:hypothetical protein
LAIPHLAARSPYLAFFFSASAGSEAEEEDDSEERLRFFLSLSDIIRSSYCCFFQLKI